MDSAFDEDGKPLYEDRLGAIYMAWSFPSAGHGQFFTPMEIARMMAMMTV